MCKKNIQLPYLAIYIYRTLQFIVFFRLRNLNKTLNNVVTHTSHEMHENRCVLLESDMHVRPMNFTVLCTPTDSSDKTQLMCSTILLCLFVSQSDSSVTKLNYNVPCPATKLTLLISKSFVGIKQSVISVALKTCLKTRLGICIYIISLLHRPDDYIGFISSGPPDILQQNCAHGQTYYKKRNV